MNNIIRFILIILACFYINTMTYSQEEKPGKNSVKISVLSLVSNVKLSYERFIGNNSLLGFSFSHYYLFSKGNKYEPYFRYSFSGTSNPGWYVEGRLAFGSFAANDYYTQYQEIYEIDYESNSYKLISSSIDQYDIEYEFNTKGASLNTGYRLFFAKNENAFIDLNFGVQYFPYYNYYNVETEVEYKDRQKIITYKVWGEQESNMTENKKYWTYLGAGAIINVNISVGMSF